MIPSLPLCLSVNMEELFLPQDIALNIASFLQVSDLCSLGSCSRFWRKLCASEFLWTRLSKQRWPSIDFFKETAILDGGNNRVVDDSFPFLKTWRSFYIKWHKVMADRATHVVQLVKQCSQSDESLEGADYLRAIRQLHSMELGFLDVQLFLFGTKKNVLLNLIGVHYCLFHLGIPAEDVTRALSNLQISERQVCVRWWKLGRWFQGFRLRDESRARRISLGELGMEKEEEVVGVLQRGAIHEVLRVQILAYHESPSWVSIHSFKQMNEACR